MDTFHAMSAFFSFEFPYSESTQYSKNNREISNVYWKNNPDVTPGNVHKQFSGNIPN